MLLKNSYQPKLPSIAQFIWLIVLRSTTAILMIVFRLIGGHLWSMSQRKNWHRWKLSAKLEWACRFHISQTRSFRCHIPLCPLDLVSWSQHRLEMSVHLHGFSRNLGFVITIIMRKISKAFRQSKSFLVDVLKANICSPSYKLSQGVILRTENGQCVKTPRNSWIWPI